MISVELKSCPFCGGKAIVNTVPRFIEKYTVFNVGCRRCGATGCNYSTKKEAAEAWNRRSSDE